MTKPSLHPWLSTPEAVKAAERATKIPLYKMPGPAQAVGPDELFSVALEILTECAQRHVAQLYTVCQSEDCAQPLTNVRANSKFCSRTCKTRHTMRRQRAGYEENPGVPAPPKTHIGSMWTWPADQRSEYAAREVGLRLCHFLVTRSGRSEVPSSQRFERLNVTQIDVSAEDVEYLRALDDFETAGIIPWHLLSPEQVALLQDADDNHELYGKVA